MIKSKINSTLETLTSKQWWIGPLTPKLSMNEIWLTLNQPNKLAFLLSLSIIQSFETIWCKFQDIEYKLKMIMGPSHILVVLACFSIAFGFPRGERIKDLGTPGRWPGVITNIIAYVSFPWCYNLATKSNIHMQNRIICLSSIFQFQPLVLFDVNRFGNVHEILMTSRVYPFEYVYSSTCMFTLRASK